MIASYAGETRPVRFADPDIACSTIPPTVTIQTLADVAVPLESALPRPTSPIDHQQEKQRRRISSGPFRPSSGAPDENGDEDGEGAPASFWERYREWAGLCSLAGEEHASFRDKLRWQRNDRADDAPFRDEAGEEGSDAWGLARGSCRPGHVSVISATGMFHPRRLAQEIGHIAASEQ